MDDARRINVGADETWRLFIAVPLPIGAREVVAELEDRLKTPGWPVKWVDPDLAHITLKFLGDTQKNLVPAIERELDAVTAMGKSAELVVGKVGACPSKNRARVIWLGLDGDVSPLAELAQEIDRAMREIGFSSDHRTFRPHITLGRLRQGKTPPVDFADVVKTVNLPNMSVPLDRLQLVRSVLGYAGPTYTTLREWPLGTSPVDTAVTSVELVEHG